MIRASNAYGAETTMSKAEKYDGLPLRVFFAGSDLVLVMEPMDDTACFWQLAETVSEIRFKRPKTPDYCLDAIKHNFGNPAWITINDGKSVIFEGDFCETMSFDCDAVVVTQRKLDYDDIRDKFLVLSQIFKTSEETTGTLLTKHRAREEAVLKYIESQRQKCSLKRDFFLKTDPAKSKAFDARLEVLADIERLLTTAATDSAE